MGLEKFWNIVEEAFMEGIVEGYNIGYDDGYDDGTSIMKKAVSDGLRHGSKECAKAMKTFRKK